MEINVKLYSPFVATLNKLKKKYGEEFEKLNGLHNDQLSFTDFIDHFIDSDNTANASIDGNANVKQQDICSLENEMNKPHQKLLSYNKIFYEITKKYGLKTAEEWLENEWNGAFYLHDGYSASFKSYCFAYDLEDLVHKGLYFVDGFGGGAPQHLTTFMSHVKEFTSWTSNRTSGACGLPTLLVHAYYFWKHDVENGYYLVSPEYYRDQCFQELIYGLNQPYLRVNQCSFTNVTIMDRPYLTEIFGGRQYPDGTYVIDYIEEIIQFQKDFMRVVSEIRQKDMFTFPVLTYSLLYQNGKFVDEEFARWASDHNSLWCDSNFFVGDSVTSLSSCCRLVNQFDKLDGFINSIGGTALKIGSVKVNTINLARIALEANKDKNKFLSILKKRTTLDLKVLDVVRHIIIRNVEKGLLPNYTHNLIDIKNQYNTIGVNAMMEAIDTMGMLYQDEIGNYHYTDEGLNFSCEILDTINAIKDEFAKDKDYSVNVEAVPAERCASVNCAKDNILYPNQIHETLYSNQWIALATPTSINERIRLASVLDKKCGGGQILHVNCDTPFTDKDVAWDVLNYIAKSGVIYFAFNTKISSCENGHGFYGEACPTCGKEKTDTFSRIVGFLVPTSQYSKARSKEYAKRYWYDMKDDI